MSTTRRPLGHGPVPAVAADQESPTAPRRTAAKRAAQDEFRPSVSETEISAASGRRPLGDGPRS
ncbi:hypothetical protein ACFQ9Q_11535 [Streptomyces virginiae]|uniref:hypothetical protein n=1 Tax=Streptomyces virginiae TaxID=1961 RepID=UPI00368C6B22